LTISIQLNVFAKDLILTLIKKIGVKGATNAVLEFGGEVIEKMTLESRMTIANMAVEAGATSGMMMVNKATIEYLWPILKNQYSSPQEALKSLSIWNSEPGAEYEKIIEINVSEIKPVITENYSPAEVVNVSELAGKLVDQVYIGSCTNGKLEDLRIAAKIISLTGKKIANNLRCIIIPASQFIYQKVLEEGLTETKKEVFGQHCLEGCQKGFRRRLSDN